MNYLKIDYSKYTLNNLIKLIGVSRYWDLPPMLEEVFKKINNINTNILDEFTTLGTTTLTSNSINISTGYGWTINSENYANFIEQNISIPFSTSGTQRIDIFVATTNNNFIRIAGIESVNPIQPATPENTLFLTFVLAGETQIEEPILPDFGALYVEKEEKKELNVNVNNIFSVSSKSSSFIFGNNVLQCSGLNFTSNSLYYEGKKYSFKNGKTVNIILKNRILVSGNVRFVFPNEIDFILKPGEIVEFILRSRKFLFFEYVGVINPPIDLSNYFDKTIDTTDGIIEGVVKKFMTVNEKNKLEGIEINATKNSTDIQLRDRATHTGTQLSSTISDFVTAVALQITSALSGYATQAFVTSQGYIINVVTALGYTPLNKAGDTTSGLISFLSGTFGLRNVANTFTSFFTNTNTVSRIYTLQNKDGIIAHIDDLNVIIKNILANVTVDTSFNNSIALQKANATITLPTGLGATFNFVIRRFSATTTTFVAGAGTTISTESDATSFTGKGMISVFCDGANNFIIAGQ